MGVISIATVFIRIKLYCGQVIECVPCCLIGKQSQERSNSEAVYQKPKR